MAIKIKDKNKLFFVSDCHFGHFNIIRLAQRMDNTIIEPDVAGARGTASTPIEFKSADAMNDEIIRRWNQIVPADAVVIDLGDFMFKLPMKKAAPILKRLNFKEIHFIKGNHGRNYYKEFENVGRKVVVHDRDIVHIIVDDDEFDDGKCEFQVCHYPLYEHDRKFKGAFHLFGHTHKDLYYSKVALHVGIDTWNLRPASYQEILTRMYVRAADDKLWK